MRFLARLRPGLWRLVALNSIAIVATFVVLAASPAPVHFPSTHWEAVLLAAAAVLFLFANLALAATAVARSIVRGKAARTETAELSRLRRIEHYDVLSDDGLIGIVDEVVATRDGTDEILIVIDGWFGVRRFYVPAAEASSLDRANRVVHLKSRVEEESRG